MTLPHHISSHNPPPYIDRASMYLSVSTARSDTSRRCNAAPLTHSLTHHCSDIRTAGGGALQRSKALPWSKPTPPPTAAPPRPMPESDRSTSRHPNLTPLHTHTHTQRWRPYAKLQQPIGTHLQLLLKRRSPSKAMKVRKLTKRWVPAMQTTVQCAASAQGRRQWKATRHASTTSHEPHASPSVRSHIPPPLSPRTPRPPSVHACSQQSATGQQATAHAVHSTEHHTSRPAGLQCGRYARLTSAHALVTSRGVQCAARRRSASQRATPATLRRN